MDDIDTCSIRGHEYGSLLNERGGHICLNCGHVDEDYERPDEWQENDLEGWNDDTPNSALCSPLSVVTHTPHLTYSP